MATKAKKSARPVPCGRRPSKEALQARAWIESVNPLRGLTASKAQAIYDSARRGDTVWLQWIYQEMEGVDPTLMICAERRGGALVDLDWCIRKRPASRVAGFDEILAEEQTAYLETVFGRAEDANLWDAVEHLSQAFFRGFAHVAPVYGDGGMTLERFETIDSWNVVRDINTNTWFWNPEASMFLPDYTRLEPVPPDEICSLVRPRHIDYPAMTIYLRSALGEKAWGQFVERYGIPPVIIVMPPDIDPNLTQQYTDAAEKVAEGGSGALPAGSDVTYAEGGRGVNPFTQFLDHQQQLVVLMATGGMFTSLTGATGIGQGATAAHQDTWRSIVQRDAATIAAAINRQVTARLLDAAFPGRPRLASFDFETEPAPTADEVFEMAGRAKTAGYIVAQADLEEKTGYTLEKAPESSGFGMGTGLFNSETPRKPVASPLQNRLADENDPTHARSGKTLQNASDAVSRLAAAYAGDLRPLAVELEALASLPDAELAGAAEKLSKRLPELLAGDPQAAAELERIIGALLPESPAANSATDQPRGKTSGESTPGSFAPAGGGAGKDAGEKDAGPSKPDKTKFPRDYEPDEAKWPVYDAADPKARENNQKRGRNAILKSLHEEKDVPNAMYRESLGPIDFPYGKTGTAGRDFEDGYGVAKIAVKHPEALEKIPGVIAHGKVYGHETEKDRYYVVSRRNTVVLQKKPGANAYLVTGFDYSAQRISKIIKNPLVENQRARRGGLDA